MNLKVSILEYVGSEGPFQVDRSNLYRTYKKNYELVMKSSEVSSSSQFPMSSTIFFIRIIGMGKYILYTWHDIFYFIFKKNKHFNLDKMGNFHFFSLLQILV